MRIAVTMGDPAGVGPEICLRALGESSLRDTCVPTVFGSAGVLRRVASECRLPPPEAEMPLADWEAAEPASLPDVPLVVDCGCPDAGSVVPGKAQAACGRAMAAYVEAAVRAALQARVAGIATAPIHKEALRLAGIPYPGHTEMLAALTGCRRFCMMMASEEIKVSLATVHVAYESVPPLLTPARIAEVLDLTAAAVRRLGVPDPVIAVCGLNPHAGEHGLFGAEEANVIEPAIAAARAGGLTVVGPLPADTAFVPERRRSVHAYVAMYHDQGLIPFKMLAFETGVNITLGLPIVRTSVDHGTAYDIAWEAKASPLSLFESLRWAVRLASSTPPPAAV
jgi:4-hydroxythreonine-4-phosphate dehydrogenase